MSVLCILSFPFPPCGHTIIFENCYVFATNTVIRTSASEELPIRKKFAMDNPHSLTVFVFYGQPNRNFFLMQNKKRETNVSTRRFE